MQPDAHIEAFNPSTKQWESVGSNIGWGAGHIGFVMQANYFKEGYWEILMRSANWDSRWNYGKGNITENGCPNVTISKIRVYNGPATSYWRLVK